MRPYRIQLHGATLASLIIVGGSSFLAPAKLAAQGPIQSTTYTATLTSNGNQATPDTLHFPQYSPPSGYTLVSAVLKSTISANITLQLTNTGIKTAKVTPSVNDEDIVQLNGIIISDTTISKSYSSVNVSPGTTYTLGPTLSFNNQPAVYDSIPNSSPLLNSFIGTGTLNLSDSNLAGYMLAVTGGAIIPNPTYQITTNFSLTYYYYNTTILATGIVTFTASRHNDQTIALNWITTNEQPGRKYNVEVSTDGSSFTSVDSQTSDPVNSNGSYFYNYTILPGASGKLYFRLKQVDMNGTTLYSAIRIIDLGSGTSSGLSLYPNPPSDFINLNLPLTGSSWQVDILSAEGSLMQRNYYTNANVARVNFTRKLPAGTYFARATDTHTTKSYTRSFLMQ
jgi:hypothetical protein